MANSHEGSGVRTQILGRFEQAPATPQIATPRPSGSRRRDYEEVQARKIKYATIPEPMDFLDDPRYASADNTQLFAVMPQIGNAVQELRARRANPEFQAMVMRWEGYPVKSLQEWQQKARDYKNGGYELHPQNAAEEAFLKEELAAGDRERQKARDAQQERLAAERAAQRESHAQAEAIKLRMGQVGRMEMPAIPAEVLQVNELAEAPDVKTLALKIEKLARQMRMPNLTEREIAMLKYAYDKQQLVPGSSAHQFARFTFDRAAALVPPTRQIPVMQPNLPPTREFQATPNTLPPQPAPKKSLFAGWIDKLRS